MLAMTVGAAGEGGERQYHVRVAPGELGHYVLMAGDPGRIPGIARRFAEAREVTAHRGYVAYAGCLEGVRVGAVAHGIGGPSLAIVAEELVRAGVRVLIRLGTCGGISPEVAPGDLVVVRATVRHEGLSSAYLPPEFPLLTDPGVAWTLTRTCRELGKRFHVGVVESKDSFYGEVHPDSMPVRNRLLERWAIMREVGVLASEMECAALFAVATVRRVRAGALLKVVTTLGDHPGSPSAPHAIAWRGEAEDLVEAGVEALRRLIREDFQGTGPFPVGVCG